MNVAIQNKLAKIKTNYDAEGFVVLGIFGSAARGDETTDSDIDILYETTEKFKNQYKGFKYFGRLSDIKDELKCELGREVDIADKNCLNRIGRKYILPGVLYVK